MVLRHRLNNRNARLDYTQHTARSKTVSEQSFSSLTLYQYITCFNKELHQIKKHCVFSKCKTWKKLGTCTYISVAKHLEQEHK